MNTTQNDYTAQAQNFATKHNVKLSFIGLEYKKHFTDDKDSRYVFKCRLQRGKMSYTFNFGQSINDQDKEHLKQDWIYWNVFIHATGQ